MNGWNWAHLCLCEDILRGHLEGVYDVELDEVEAAGLELPELLQIRPGVVVGHVRFHVVDTLVQARQERDKLAREHRQCR